MIGGVVMLTPRGPRRSWVQRFLNRKPKLTVRQLGAVASDLQAAEAQNIHADRERCVGCKIGAGVLHALAISHLPDRYAKNKDWMHRHVQAPGARIAARHLDEMEAGR